MVARQIVADGSGMTMSPDLIAIHVARIRERAQARLVCGSKAQEALSY